MPHVREPDDELRPAKRVLMYHGRHSAYLGPGLPRIDYYDSAVAKIFLVSCRDCRASRTCDCRYLAVKFLNWTAHGPAAAGDIGECAGRSFIKRQDTFAKPLFYQVTDSIQESSSTVSSRQNGGTIEQLCLASCGQVQVGLNLDYRPNRNVRIGFRAQEFRKNVRIENDRASIFSQRLAVPPLVLVAAARTR